MQTVAKNIGRYEITEELGRGAMGVVYLGRDPVIDRKLAIKTIRLLGLLQDDSSGEYLARFYQEAKAAGKLSHPGIVTVFDVGQDSDSGMHYLVMEFVEGPNVKTLLNDPSFAFDYDLVARIGANVADALSYAHRHQVIHRDIKPANIILSINDIIKLTDFGIAKLPQSELTSDGQFVGTPSYMSPEQIRGLNVDNRSDIFSLGIVIYEILSGKKPFEGDDLAMVSHKIAYEQQLPLKDLVPDTPSEILYVVERSLAKDPASRFEDAGEMAEILRTYLYKTKAGMVEQTRILPGDKRPPSPPPAAANQNLEETQKVKKSSLPPRRPTLNVIRHYRGMKSWLADHKSLYFLALPIYFRWVAILVLLLLFLTGAPILLLSKNLQKLSQFSPPPVNMIERVELRKELLAEAEEALREDDQPKALLAIRKILTDTPLAPYPMALYRQAMEKLHTIEPEKEEPQETRDQQLKLSNYLSNGKRLYESGEYSESRYEFNRALRIDSKNNEARRYLSMIKMKMDLLKQKYQTPVTPGQGSQGSSETSVPAPSINRPSQITFHYDSPIGEGFLVINVDGTQLYRQEFEFIKRSGFLKKKKEFTGGELSGELTLKPGPHSVQIWIVSTGKDKVNTYVSEKLQIKSSLDYQWEIKLNKEANSIKLNMKEIPYAPDAG